MNNNQMIIVSRKATFRESIFGRVWRLWYQHKARRAAQMRLDAYELSKRSINTQPALYHE